MGERLDARALFRVLADHRVEYLVVGGFAVQAHGFRRGTVDLDIVARPDLANQSRLGEALVSIGARDTRSDGSSATETSRPPSRPSQDGHPTMR